MRGRRDYHKSVQVLEQLLDQYEQLLEAVSRASNVLIVHECIPEAIQCALQAFGEAIKARRVFIFQYHPHSITGEPAISMKYEWVREGERPALYDLDEQDVPIRKKGTEQIIEQLKAGNITMLDLETLPEQSRYEFQKKQVPSHQLIPIMIGNQLWGFYGIADKEETRWSDINQSALFTMAGSLGATIKQLQEYEARVETDATFADMVENVPGVIFQCVKRHNGTYGVRYVSPKALDMFGIEVSRVTQDVQEFLQHIPKKDQERYRREIHTSLKNMQPLDVKGRINTPFGEVKWWRSISRPSRAKNGDIIFNGILMDMTSQKRDEEALYRKTNELKQANRKLEELSRIDSLTGIANRRRFNEFLEFSWDSAKRTGGSLSVIFIDIDDFKAYNDYHGHLQGDDCIEKIAFLLKSSLKRSTDFVARMGGEEFVAVLPGTNVEGAVLVAEMMRSRVEAEGMKHEGADSHSVVTISAGVSAANPKDSVITRHQLLNMADAALYEAKNEGKNQVFSKHDDASS